MTYQQVTLAQMQTSLLERVETVPFWTSAEATSAINEALRIWNMLTGYWKATATIPTVAGVGNNWYAVSPGILYQTHAEWGKLPLELSSIGDLDYGQPGWEADVAGGTRPDGTTLPPRPLVFAPAGLNLFAIWPNDATANQLALDSIVQTPVLVNSGDYVDIGDEELHAILGYALHYLAFKEGGARFTATQVFYKQFISAAADQNAKLNASVFFRNAMGTDVNRNQRPMKKPLQSEQPPQGGAQ